jgi:glycosyltransferase involved in cell wall biosynthesis
LDTPDAVPVGLSGTYVVKGWCFTPNPSDLTLTVRVGETDIPVFIGLPRPDVARHFKNALIEECGFVARFQCPPDLKSVSLLATLDGTSFPLIREIPIPDLPHKDGQESKAGTYSDWIRLNERSLFLQEEEEAAKLQNLPQQPMLSIILPTCNTPRYFLRRCIESVFEQHYRNWQLCITDDGSSDENVHTDLKHYAEQDKRIHLTFSADQQGISAASNCSLANAQGSFVVLLDHDDELHPHALLELARSMNEFPDADLFYSDEDKIDELGGRSQSSFKPDFDIDIFLSFNYLGHMVALRRTLVNNIGGFDPACDGAQDWDLLLRATEVIDPVKIKHIRKPLYHCRIPPDSTSFNLDAKPSLAKVWAKAVADHIERTGTRERNALNLGSSNLKPGPFCACSLEEGLFYGSMRLRYAVPRHIRVGVFIRPEDGVFQSSIIRINAGQLAVNLYELLDCAVFEEQGSRSFYSLTQLPDDVFVFINGPLESLNHLFFEELAAQCLRDDCGLVTGIAVDHQNRIIATGFLRTAENEFIDPYVGARFPNRSYMGLLNVVRSLDACPATFFAISRQQLADVGGLGVLGSPDTHFLVRSLAQNAHNKGLRIISTPYAIATFAESFEPPAVYNGEAKQVSDILRLNPQILSFEDPIRFLQGNVE